MTQSVRIAPLTADEIEVFTSSGYLLPGRVFDTNRVARLREALGRVRDKARVSGVEFDLLDPTIWPTDEQTEPHHQDRQVGYLFNLRLQDHDLREVSFSPVIARWAAQLIGARRVRILEDDAIFKEPGTGGALAWHQDFAYWPLAQPNVVSAWVALDDVTEESGALRMAVGSHLNGERLPVAYHTGTPYMQERRAATVRPIGRPDEEYPVTPVELLAGEVVLHHGLTLHASGPNETSSPRRAVITRYVGDGTIWLGSHRYEFNYADDEVGISIGDPLGGRYFPIVPF